MHLSHEQETKAVEECIIMLRRCQKAGRIPDYPADEGHQDADDVLLDFLQTLGYLGVIKEYNDVIRQRF